MNTFRKIGVILLALLMLAATTGGHFYAHHCNAMQRTTFLWKNSAGGCCHEITSHGTPEQNQDAGVRFLAQPCCETEGFFIHWKPQVQIPANVPIQPPAELEKCLDLQNQENLLMDAGIRPASANRFTPPPLSGRERVFFIHQPKIPSPATV